MERGRLTDLGQLPNGRAGCTQGGRDAQCGREHGMSDSEQGTPEVAPAHTDVRAEFSRAELGMVIGLGGVAIIVGTILGLVLTT